MIEAYILHEKVICFVEKESYYSKILAPDPEAFGFYERVTIDKQISPLIKPLISSQLSTDLEDIRRARRMLTSERFRRTAKPSKVRTYDEWISLLATGDTIRREFVRAEYILSQQLRATFYPPSRDADFIGAQVVQFNESAAALLEQFTKARSSQIAEIQKLIRPHEIEVSPPLLLAYAVASSNSLQGFQHVVRDLRNDAGVEKLRKIILEVSLLKPVEQNRLYSTIQTELREILGLQGGSIELAETISSIPTFFSGSWASLIKTVDQITRIDELIEQLKVRSSLNILRKLHRSVPNVKQFYQDLKRVFGFLHFDEAGLRRWIANPSKNPYLRRAESPAESQLTRDTRKAFDWLNRRIKNRSSARESK